MRKVLSVIAVAALAVSVFSYPAHAVAPAGGGGFDASRGPQGDVKPLPKFVRAWQESKEAAADAVARGKAKPDRDGIVELPNGTFVDYELLGTDHIVVMLADFSDPVHDQIAEPDRSKDNSTYWVPEFDRTHYEDMLFSDGGGSYGAPSVRDYYLQQSSGRYTVGGQVGRWVRLDQTESYYGANGADGAGSDNANGPVYRVIRDALEAAAVQDAGINWDPNVVDVWDRYDCDSDGDFNEPDGYVDHFMLVHAGQGEEAGGGAQGGDAIWSHRWYANAVAQGAEGPEGCKLGGYPVPGTNLWVGDYTIEPENGGVGVFAHEFGHDLGLPDLYDTAGGENSTGFWTLMSSGSWASDAPDSIGGKPTHMGAWEKLVLGWLQGDLARASLGQDRVIDLGPAEGRQDQGYAQALRVDLPAYERTTTLAPPEGADPYYYFSGRGDNLENTMTHQLGAPLEADSVLSFRAWYDIEPDWDYAYVEYTKDGSSWEPVDGNLSTSTNPYGQNQGYGITGSSNGWTSGSYTIPAGATAIRFRYWTDGAVSHPGFIVDSISLGTFSDDGSKTAEWSFAGFKQITGGRYSERFFHYYLVESRSYLRNDASLKGAYNFLRDEWLEKQPYADGLLIWYRNGGYADNNVSEHPGYGEILPVDSHPRALTSPFGGDYLRRRWQSWDSTFALHPHEVTLHEYVNGQLVGKTYKAKPVSSFVDSSPAAYYDPRLPQSAVKTAGSGLIIDITGISADHGSYRVHVHR